MTSIAWHPHPDVWFLVAVLVGGYVWAVRRIGPRAVHPVERPVTGRQVLCYLLGVATLWLASDWPVHELAEGHLYSVHMTQHILMMFVAPPLLMIGTPAWLWRTILGRGAVLRVARVVTRPLVALAGFNIVMALIHVPGVVDLMTRSETFHFGMHLLVVVASVCMWSPVLNPLIELPRLSYPGRMVYLFAQSLVPTVPASFLTFGDTVLYRFYETAGNPWGISALSDMRVAGLIMKIVGGAILWGFIAVYFFKWFGAEEREGIDVLEMGRMESELNKAELTKS